MLNNNNIIEKTQNIIKYFGIIAVILIIGFSVASFSSRESNLSNAWEYLVFQYSPTSDNEYDALEPLNEDLNKLGAEGWELVSNSANYEIIVSRDDSIGNIRSAFIHVFILKRKL